MTDRELDARLAEALGYTLKRVGVSHDPECGGYNVCADCDAEHDGFTVEDMVAEMPPELHDYIRETWHAAHHEEMWAFVTERNALELVPEYSTTWEGMQQVVEAMRARGWCYCLQGFPPDATTPPSTWLFEAKFWHKDDATRVGVWAFGPTQPQAVALAALKALGVAMEAK